MGFLLVLATAGLVCAGLRHRQRATLGLQRLGVGHRGASRLACCSCSSSLDGRRSSCSTRTSSIRASVDPRWPCSPCWCTPERSTSASGSSRTRRCVSVHGPRGPQGLVGQHLGWSDYHEVTQEQVEPFADATGDHQWIHVDPERANGPVRRPHRPRLPHPVAAARTSCRACGTSRASRWASTTAPRRCASPRPSPSARRCAAAPRSTPSTTSTAACQVTLTGTIEVRGRAEAELRRQGGLPLLRVALQPGTAAAGSDRRRRRSSRPRGRPHRQRRRRASPSAADRRAALDQQPLVVGRRSGGSDVEVEARRDRTAARRARSPGVGAADAAGQLERVDQHAGTRPASTPRVGEGRRSGGSGTTSSATSGSAAPAAASPRSTASPRLSKLHPERERRPARRSAEPLLHRRRSLGGRHVGHADVVVLEAARPSATAHTGLEDRLGRPGSSTPGATRPVAVERSVGDLERRPARSAATPRKWHGEAGRPGEGRPGAGGPRGRRRRGSRRSAPRSPSPADSAGAV